MAKYMVQTMRHAVVSRTYYRKQSAHPSHEESGQFTTDAKQAFADTFVIVNQNDIEVGKYMSSQGAPTNPNAIEI